MEHILKDLNTNVYSESVNVAVSKLKTTNKGNVIVECEEQSEVRKLHAAIGEKMGRKYELEQAKFYRPRIIDN